MRLQSVAIACNPTLRNSKDRALLRIVFPTMRTKREWCEGLSLSTFLSTSPDSAWRRGP